MTLPPAVEAPPARSMIKTGIYLLGEVEGIKHSILLANKEDRFGNIDVAAKNFEH